MHPHGLFQPIPAWIARFGVEREITLHILFGSSLPRGRAATNDAIGLVPIAVLRKNLAGFTPQPFRLDIQDAVVSKNQTKGSSLARNLAVPRGRLGSEVETFPG